MIPDNIYHTMTMLNDSINAERALAEEHSGYDRSQITAFVDQWTVEERKGVCTFTVPCELYDFFMARAAFLKFLRDHPEVHEHIVWYRRPQTVNV